MSSNKVFLAFLALVSLSIISSKVLISSAAPSYPSRIENNGSLYIIKSIGGIRGRGLYTSGYFKPVANEWTINLDYKPLNGTASVQVTDLGGTLRATKSIKTTSSGSLKMKLPYYGAVRVSVYASEWSVTAE
jgi:Tol biopolymer transport system component